MTSLQPGQLWPEQPAPTEDQIAARVRTERRGHVLAVSMTRTEKRNAIDLPMTTALDRALDTLDDDPELRCGVLTGGPSVFCAGTDIAVGPGAPTPRGGNYGVVARQRTTPLVAAAEGIAFGGRRRRRVAHRAVRAAGGRARAGRQLRGAVPRAARPAADGGAADAAHR
jgi:enoyl-CoA hydratase